MNNISSYERLSNKELKELIKFGFTCKGFYEFKRAFNAAKGVLPCQPQK